MHCAPVSRRSHRTGGSNSSNLPTGTTAESGANSTDCREQAEQKGSKPGRLRGLTRAHLSLARRAWCRSMIRETMPAALGSPITTNIPQRMDRLPWSRWHWLVVTALGVTWVLDGLEVSIVAALGPVLTHATTLHLTESEVGLAASAYLAGSVLGAVVFSYL